MRLLADYHYNGVHVKRDLKKALKWADLAVRAGDDTISLLWPMIRGTHDFELLALPALEAKNYRNAFKPMYSAANLEHPGAMFHMGRMFGEGLGIGVDKKKAAYFHRQLMVGDKIVFGRYRQEKEYAEPIVWRIIACEKGRALLLSEKILECRKYHSIESEYDEFLAGRKDGEAFAASYEQGRRIQQAKSTGVTWEKSDLRRWLNSSFADSAFSGEERMSVMQTAVSTPANPGYHTNPGSLTYDQVFVLSAQEAAEYLDNRKEPFMYSNDDWGKYYLLSGWHVKADVTGHVSQVNNRYRFRMYASWWLRTPGKMQHMAAVYLSDGWSRRLSLDGLESGNPAIGVRPAIWVRLWN